jgi:hypothetical protein
MLTKAVPVSSQVFILKAVAGVILRSVDLNGFTRREFRLIWAKTRRSLVSQAREEGGFADFGWS